MIRNNQNRRRRGGNNNNGPRPQQMNGGNNYGNRLDNRQRGNASQLLEKYRALARDAQQAGDRVTAEYYLQYADHYYRVLGDYREKTPADGRQRGQNFYEDDSAGYSANGEDGDDGDEEQDGDRAEMRGQDDRGDNRGDGRADNRGDENRSQWRDDRGGQAQNNSQNGNRQREGQQQREPRAETRGDAPRDGNRSENRDRQGWSGNGVPRNRDDNRNERPRDDNRVERPREENRAERPRDENRSERPRDENRGDRNINRDRRPDNQRQAPVEAAPVEPRQTESRMVDEGPIPGLPGPATLRMKRPVEEDAAPRPERAPRTPRREIVAEPVVEQVSQPVMEALIAESPAVDGEAPAPRRRGRPRKVVESAPAEG